MESWFKKAPKKELTTKERRDKDYENDQRVKKIGIVGLGAAAAATGAIGGAEMAIHDHPSTPAEPMPNFDTMPVGYENPTAGKTPDSAPDPIVIHNAGGLPEDTPEKYGAIH